MSKSRSVITSERISKIIDTPDSKVHFLGIGGVSMSALASLTVSLGVTVTGSDREDSARTRRLASSGIRLSVGKASSELDMASLVVYTHAIPDDDPELTFARKQGIPTVSRAEYMGAIMGRYSCRVGVCGSHGKSTTVAMLERILTAAGEEPTVLSGASLSTVNSSYLAGGNGMLLYEACEYKDSFHHFLPTVSVALNLELDHPDYFKSLADLRDSFTVALSKTSGFVVLNSDDAELEKIIPRLSQRVVTFGTRSPAEYRYNVISFSENSFIAVIEHKEKQLVRFTSRVPGVFNVANAAAAIVTAVELGIAPEIAADAVAGFSGISRRLERIGSYHGCPVYYDYAHHPTEISASVTALRPMFPEGITVVFKPHTYSRTAALWDDFRSSLSLADRVILTDIYGARETPVPGVSSRRLAYAIGPRAVYSRDSDVQKYIDPHTCGAIVLMGAGNMDKIRSDLLDLKG